MRLQAVMMSTYINNLPGLASFFNNTCLSGYLRPRKVVFDNGSEFKRDFNPLLHYFNIKAVLTTIKNPQANTMLERGHQAILNMLATKFLDKKVL